MRQYMYHKTSRTFSLISISSAPSRTSTVSSAINILFASFSGELVSSNSISVVWVIWYEFKSSPVVSYCFRSQQFYLYSWVYSQESKCENTNVNTFPLSQNFMWVWSTINPLLGTEQVWAIWQSWHPQELLEQTFQLIWGLYREEVLRVDLHLPSSAKHLQIHFLDNPDLTAICITLDILHLWIIFLLYFAFSALYFHVFFWFFYILSLYFTFPFFFLLTQRASSSH